MDMPMPPLKALEEAGLIVTVATIEPASSKRTERRKKAQPQPGVDAPSSDQIESEFERLSAELLLNDKRIDISN